MDTQQTVTEEHKSTLQNPDPTFLQNIYQTVKAIQFLKPEFILDIGIGVTGKYACLIREYLPYVKHLAGIEGYEPYASSAINAVGYDSIVLKNILDVDWSIYKGHQYELFMLIDVIEHLEYEDGLKLLAQFAEIGVPVLISTPKEFFRVEHENPLQRHLSHWDIGQLTTGWEFEDFSTDLSTIVVLTKPEV